MQTIETLQEEFLQTVCHSRCQVTVFLMNGYQLRGQVVDFDDSALVVQAEGRQNMVYKHAISTISPAAPVRLRGDPTAP